MYERVPKYVIFLIREYIYYCLYNFDHDLMLTWFLLTSELRKNTISLDTLAIRTKPHTKKRSVKNKLPATRKSLLLSAKIVIYNQSKVSRTHTYTPYSNTCSVIELCYRYSTLYLHRAQYLPITLPLSHSISLAAAAATAAVFYPSALSTLSIYLYLFNSSPQLILNIRYVVCFTHLGDVTYCVSIPLFVRRFFFILEKGNKLIMCLTKFWELNIGRGEQEHVT